MPKQKRLREQPKSKGPLMGMQVRHLSAFIIQD